MTRPVTWQTRVGLTALRVLPAAMLVVHGSYRIATGGVTGFGEFLGSQLPFGAAVAWLLSLVEVFGGLTLIAGRLVVPLCLWFATELTVGIVLVHLPNGWFVVGGGRNGMEYSVVLVTCFLINALLAPFAQAVLSGATAPAAGDTT